MKKLVVIIAITLSSMMTLNAAEVLWTITTLNQVGSTARVPAASTSYMLYLVYSADNVADFSVNTGTGAITISDTVVDSFNPTSSGGTGLGGRLVNYAYTTATASYYFLAVFDSGGAAGIAGGVDNYYTSSILTGKPYAESPNVPDLTLSWAINSTATWTAVPEPTSMALLAIGVAALGLRRKLQK